jgi:hypothetical protein
MATHSLPQSTLDTFQPVSASAVHVLARMAAKRAVTEQLRAEGVVSLVPPRDISAKAQVYLGQHPELYREALDRAQRLGMYERRRRKSGVTKLKTNAQSREQPKSITSAVQMSCAK